MLIAKYRSQVEVTNWHIYSDNPNKNYSYLSKYSFIFYWTYFIYHIYFPPISYSLITYTLHKIYISYKKNNNKNVNTKKIQSTHNLIYRIVSFFHYYIHISFNFQSDFERRNEKTILNEENGIIIIFFLSWNELSFDFLLNEKKVKI